MVPCFLAPGHEWPDPYGVQLERDMTLEKLKESAVTQEPPSEKGNGGDEAGGNVEHGNGKSPF